MLVGTLATDDVARDTTSFEVMRATVGDVVTLQSGDKINEVED